MSIDDLLHKLDRLGDLNNLSIVAVVGGYEARVVLASKYATPGHGRSSNPVKACMVAYEDAQRQPKPKQPRLRMKG